MEIELEGWIIKCHVDEDGMLEVCVKNCDESPVVATDTDKWDDNEWGERFTTEQIETDHREEERKIRHRGQRQRQLDEIARNMKPPTRGKFGK